MKILPLLIALIASTAVSAVATVIVPGGTAITYSISAASAAVSWVREVMILVYRF
jgi:hypothetical protein